MVSFKLGVIFITCLLFGTLNANKCTSLCNMEGLLSPTTEMCGTDYNTYKAPLSAIVGLPPPWSCYRQCGIDVLYPGVCGCPNDCGGVSNRGACVNSTCVCAAGWGGQDCNSIVCPNSCSGNGKCHSVKKHLDVCKCEDGFTGPDCSIATLSLPVLPYGEVAANNSAPYFKKDKYGDHHPIFNLSVIANWNIEMDPEAFDSLLKPCDTWNQSRQDVTVYFSNGNVHQKIHKATMKLKGHFARLAVKKSFSLRFKEKFFHIDNIVLKASSLDGTYLRNQLTIEYLRAMMVPTARASYATLTINGIFWGLYWMKEELDDKFINSRFGNNDGNFYALSHYLEYLGDNQQSYEDFRENRIGNFTCYKQEFGNENWSDLISFAKFLNQSSNEDFQLGIDKMLNIDSFVRAMVVLSAIDDPDSFTRNGNNWALYNDPKADMWQFLSKDFEETMLNPFNKANASVATNEKALLAYRVMSLPAHQELYKQYFLEFLKNCFSPKIEHSSGSRVAALETFLTPIIKTDRFFHITFGLPVNDVLYKLAVKELQLYLQTRYLSLEVQIRP